MILRDIIGGINNYMNNNVLLISVIVAAVAGVLLLVGFVFFFNVPEEESLTPSGTPYPSNFSSEVTPGGPVGGSETQVTGDRFDIAIVGERTLTVRDFRKDEDVFIDNNTNPGFYTLGPRQTEDPTQDPAYLVGFQETDSFFLITLIEEPIGEGRRQAESYLLNKLGISQTDLCALHYLVSVPWWVNELYTGKNLGFSFCPGAAPL